MTAASPKAADLRIGMALAVSAAAATLALFGWDVAVWALVYGKFESFRDPRTLWVILIAYIPALFVTVLVGGPVWLILHYLRVTKLPVFMSVGVLLAVVGFCLISGHRIRYVTLPFMPAPFVAGACGGYVLHRIAYRQGTV